MYFLRFFLLIIFTTNICADDIVKVKTYQLVEKSLYEIYRYPVVIESKQDSEIHSEIPAFVKNINVNIGTMVQAGQVLMTLQHLKIGYLPMEVKSKIHGKVTKISVKEGTQVNESDTLIHITNNSDLSFVIQIPSNEIELFSKLSQGKAFFGTEQFVPIRLVGISPEVNQITGVARAELKLDQDTPLEVKSKLFPGMLGIANFELNYHKGLAIPENTIAYEKEQLIARVLKDGKIVKVNISVGKKMSNGFREVLSGVSIGDKLVINPGKYLKDNQLAVE
jgi:multidrug efflux pump subunit AcrA (membrane-fusion protein)